MDVDDCLFLVEIFFPFFIHCRCICLWRQSLSDWANFFPQISHWNGFSLMWILRWIWSVLFHANFWMQKSHCMGFSPVLSLLLSWKNTCYISIKEERKVYCNGEYSNEYTYTDISKMLLMSEARFFSILCSLYVREKGS